MLSNIQSVFYTVVQYAVLLLEVIGVAVLMTAAVRSVIGLFRRDDGVKLQLAEGIGLALAFKLGGEVLRSLIVHTWSELAILGAIVLLRAAIMLLIQWEIRNEKRDLRLEQKTV